MKNKFAARLLELRVEKGITQSQLAQELGVLTRTVSYWEKGQRQCNIDMLITLSAYFGVTVDYLTGKTDY